MKVRLDKMTPTPSGLVMGVLVHGPKDSWVRFALLEVPFDSIPEDFVNLYWEWSQKEERRDDEDTPLAFEWA